jgi:hypothetical protein
MSTVSDTFWFVSIYTFATERYRANVDVHRRRILFANYRLHRFPEEIKVGELESRKRYVWIAMAKPLIPLFFQPIVGKDRGDKCFDTDRRLVRCSRSSAASFSAFCHDLKASTLDAHLLLIF